MVHTYGLDKASHRLGTGPAGPPWTAAWKGREGGTKGSLQAE